MDDGAFSIDGQTKKKKGTTTYYEPVFSHHSNISDETDALAKQLDEHLQEYMTAYFSQQGLDEVEREYTGQAKAASAGAFYDNEPEMPSMIPTEVPPPDENDDIAW